MDNARVSSFPVPTAVTPVVAISDWDISAVLPLPVAVELLYFPLLASMGLAVLTPIKLEIAPVAGWLAPKVQVYEAGSEAEAAL